MANLTGRAISELQEATILNDADLLAISQNGESRRLTGQTLRRQISGGENILDNWYFGVTKINQRGQAAYSSDGKIFCIDRWTITNGIVTANSTLLNIKFGNGGTSRQRFSQAIGKRLSAGTYTASAYIQVLQASDSIYVGVSSAGTLNITNGMATLSSTTANYVLVQTTFTLSEATTDIWFEFLTSATSSSQNAEINVIACKLERGSTSSLGYTTDSGSYLLDIAYDDTVELLKCQRYYLPLFGASRTATGNGPLVHALTATLAETVIPLPTTMVSTDFRVGASNLVLRHGITDINVSSVSVEWTPLGARLQLQVSSGLTAGDTYIVRANSGYLDLLAG